ncbi:c-type cytochrome [Micrococcales bacterium 31B]|nr:c-type cytochrome [Micrococcales bacterium 31B]
MKALAARRHHPMAILFILLLGLLTTGAAYTFLAPTNADASVAASADDVAEGQKLFLANCASCHGLNAQGSGGVTLADGTSSAVPSLIGVGAAAVDFQVGTGRMPMQANGPQAWKKPVQFTDQQIAQLAAYVASLAPGPAIPTAAQVDVANGDPAVGGELFRINCAMCHNAVGAGGALTRGKFAPSLNGVTGAHIYEAMATGPQNMPVFSDANISSQNKTDIIAYLDAVQNDTSPGGFTIGGIGPVAEGLWAWCVGLTLLIGCAVWLGSKSA